MPHAEYEWFIYQADPVTLAASAGSQGTTSLNIAADAPFQVHYITVSVSQSNAIVTTFDGLVEIQWSDQARTLANRAFPINAISLSGQEPYKLNPYRVIPRNSTVIITWTNSQAGAATVCFLSLHGNKIRN